MISLVICVEITLIEKFLHLSIYLAVYNFESFSHIAKLTQAAVHCRF